MNKPYMIFLVSVLTAASLLFSDQVLSVFQGMTVLEAMKQILSFILHVMWVTILGFVIITVNKLVRPWIRMFQQKQKRARHQVEVGKVRDLVNERKIQLPRGNKDQVLLWLIQQMAKRQTSPPSQPSKNVEGDGGSQIHLDF